MKNKANYSKQLLKINSQVPAPSPFPLEPMTAMRIEEPFDNPDWIYEVKFDGYRILAQVIDKKATLLSRGQLNYTSKYTALVKELSNLKNKVVLDGEVIVIGEDSKPSFNALQNYRAGDPLVYYVFDLLWFDGHNLMSLPLIERRSILKKVLPDSDTVKFSDDFPEGISLFNHLKKMGMEGIIAKRKDSLYYPGKRVNTWLKIPVTVADDYVIGGWIESDSGKLFSSVIFGSYEDGGLKYIHHAGGGFNDKNTKELFKKFQRLETKKNPFTNEVKITDKHKIHWIKPELVAEIKMSNKQSPSGNIRHPAIFVRLRDDKTPVEATDIPVVKKRPGPKSKRDISSDRSPETDWKTIEQRIITSTEEIEINGKKLLLTNVEREVWKGITKAELFNYYHNIWEYMSPYLKDRPLGLHSNPKGANAPAVWIRNMANRQPEWAEVYITERKHKKKGRSNKIHWLVCSNEETLFYIINLDSIDLHPWSSRTTSPDFPDYLLIDLDPSDNDFSKVIDTAKAAKEVFDEHKLKSFVKTSGKTGLHLYLPCTGIPFGDARTIAENVCEAIHEKIPGKTTTLVSVDARGDLLYLDPNQNDYADRIAAPYCLRAYKRPLTAAPIDWKEVKQGLNPEDFNIHSIFKRLEKKGDLLEGLLSENNRKYNQKRLMKFL